jgi:hypothetical protein
MVVVVGDEIIFHCCRAVAVSLGARGLVFPGSSQRAEDPRPFFSLHGFEILDHRRNFFIDRVKKRVAHFFGSKEKLFFNFIHRPRAKKVCRTGHKLYLRHCNVLIQL